MTCCARVILFFILFVCENSLQAQNSQGYDYPVIGKPCPEFYLRNIQHFNKKNVSLKDFKGKPLVVDLFSRGCVSCFKSFPKLNELKKEFNNEVQFLLVGLVSSERSYNLLSQSYELFREKFNLEFPVAYDSTLGKRFKIDGVPHVLFIDGNGIVKAITNQVSKENLKAFIEGKDFEYEDHSYEERTKPQDQYDPLKPFLTNDNGGNDTVFIQRSLLADWKLGMPTVQLQNQMRMYEHDRAPIQLLGLPLTALYRMAYLGIALNWHQSDKERYGNYHYSPILEIKDTSLFNSERKFCYSLVVPDAKIKDMQRIMQRDLENFFGYSVSVEMRKMPYLKLVSTDAAKLKLKTKGGVPRRDHSFGGLDFVNMPVQGVINDICLDGELVINDLPLIDDTGIEGNIDIKFKAVMTDWRYVKKGLQKVGLDLIFDYREMKCVVIRDPSNY